MGDLSLKIGWQVDDIDGAKWTFLGTNAAPNTETLRYESDFGVGRDFDAKLASSDDRTGLLAFLATFLGVSSVSDGLD